MLTIHDSERTPQARLTCEWGLLSSLGSYAGTAASAAGTALGNAATTAGTALGEGASHLAGSTGIPQLYNAAASALQSGGAEGAYLRSLGQQVPQGVEMAGPSAGFFDASPGFLKGFAQGMSGTLGQYTAPSAGTQFGQGLGMLGNFIDQARGGRFGGMTAGQYLRSALAQYGLPEQGVRVYQAAKEAGMPGGLLNLHIGGNAGG